MTEYDSTKIAFRIEWQDSPVQGEGPSWAVIALDDESVCDRYDDLAEAQRDYPQAVTNNMSKERES